MPIGTTELIVNGSFETGTNFQIPAGWTATGPGQLERSPGGSGDGAGYYAFSGSSPNHGGTIQQTVATEAGKTYSLTFKSGISWEGGAVPFNARLKIDTLNGATLIETQELTLPMRKTTGYGTYTITFTATGPQTTLRFTDTSPSGQTDFDIGLDAVSVRTAAPFNEAGEWGDLQPWPLIGIHAVITQDGKLLSFGTDKALGTANFQSAMVHDLWDPVTGQHHTLDHTHGSGTDVFCSAAIIIPGTNQILIGGGDMPQAGNQSNNDSNDFDGSTHAMTSSPEGEMSVARWYPTMISLPTGQVVVFGGTGGGYAEIFTAGEGWRQLTGVPESTFSDQTYYPRAWVNGNGDIAFYAPGGGANGIVELKVMDVSGTGSVRTVANLPFMTDWESPAIMYDAGKVLAMATNGELWTMDISGTTPVFVKIGLAMQDRNWSNMTVLANGDVLINGGSRSGNLESGSIKIAMIWDPDTGALTQTSAEVNTRVYHAATVLLPDGSVISLGSGSAGMAETNYLDGQIYKPPYLFDANGNPAVRPDITAAPDAIVPGQTFNITVDNANAIRDLTFIKTGAVTHSFNMDARAVDLTFRVIDATTIEVTVPANANTVTAGSWMLFAWNDKGVPSVAEMVAVQPTVPVYDGIGDVTAEYFTISATASTLDQVNLDAPAIHTERVTEISESGTAAYYPGGPADDFGVRFKGDFAVSQAGSYTFYLTSDDGARLKIDGVLVTETVGAQSPQSLTKTITLAAGEHKIELVYIEAGGPGQIDLDWSGPGFGRTNMTFDGADDNLISNGGLEHNGATGLGKAPYGWTISGEGGFYRTEAWAANGQGSFVMGGWTSKHDVTIAQTIDTVAGQTYTLTFSSGVSWQNAAADYNAQIKADVLNGATSLTSKNFQVGVNTSKGYNDYTITFTATGLETTIKFTDTSPGGQALFSVGLDNIVVKPADGSNVAPPISPPVTPPHSHNALANGSFETTAGGAMTMPMVHVMSNGDVPGWTSSANRIELWMNGVNGVTGTNGRNVAEIDSQNGVLSQTIKTDAGKAYGISFDYAGRPGFIPSSKMEVLWNGAVIATITPDGAVMKNYHTHAVGTGGNDVLGFRAVAGDTDDKGGLLDNVTFAVSTHEVLNPINGTTGNDYLIDTDASDTINGGDGNDAIVLSGKGNDIVDGGAGDNQIHLRGGPADYTFGRNADGLITVSSALYGTDTLKSIHGVWFTGTQQWFGIDDLAPADPREGGTGVANTINGTPGNDFIVDTDGNDTINGGDGNDAFVLSGKGNDIVDGGAGDNQVHLKGASADYTFGRNAEGLATVSSALYGTDTLKNIYGFWFTGEQAWFGINDLVPNDPSDNGSGVANTINGTAGNDFIIDTSGNDTVNGGDGNDTVVLSGKGNDIVDGGAGYNEVHLRGGAADYTFHHNADGTVTVSSTPYGTDTLKNIQGVWFTGAEEWFSIDQLAPEDHHAAATAEEDCHCTPEELSAGLPCDCEPHAHTDMHAIA